MLQKMSLSLKSSWLVCEVQDGLDFVCCYCVVGLCVGMCARHLDSEVTVGQFYRSIPHVLADLIDVCIDGVIRQVWTTKGRMIGSRL
jgi:hypothetical protein